MNGIERLRLAGRRLVLYGGLGGFVLWLVLRLSLGRFGLAELFVVSLTPILAGFGLFFTAWIAEGFVGQQSAARRDG